MNLRKRPGRGVFLRKFPQIVAMDVAAFSRYRVYLAAPLFLKQKRNYNRAVAGLLRENLFDIFLPRKQVMIRNQESKKTRFGSFLTI